MCEAVAWFSLYDGVRSRFLAVESHECLSVGVVALYIGVHGVERIVVTSFAIFRLVINCRAFDLHFSSREVTLEVLHVGGSVPEAPFCKRE